MTIEEAATELMQTYSRFGVDKREFLVRIAGKWCP